MLISLTSIRRGAKRLQKRIESLTIESPNPGVMIRKQHYLYGARSLPEEGENDSVVMSKGGEDEKEGSPLFDDGMNAVMSEVKVEVPTSSLTAR